MTTKVILYDIPARGRASCFSHNVWKTRLVFNYKQIPYETVWLEHKDIEATLKSISAPPTLSPTGQPVYTVPTILLPSGEALSDSLQIAQWAENTYPSPSLHLTSTPHSQASQMIAAATFPLIPVFMPRIPRTVLRPESVEWFEAARAARFGMELDVLERVKGGEGAWEKAGPGLDALEELVRGRADGSGGGRFVLGSEVSYADFVVVAVLEGFRRIGRDLFERIVEGREGLRGVWEGCGEFLERDD